MNNVIEVKNLSKEFRVKLKEKGLKGSLKSIFKPKYKIIKAVKNKRPLRQLGLCKELNCSTVLLVLKF